ncbi:Vegetatible incompatibility protein HET-E-1 [Candidatus Rhodobacter oscarellae]|uniref:Vegetatible incompatibility protein HET-E-1 n=1 Tax=Candidatus Rhodobacter oscarellae TaxID=1675527 RepID=A0A0J9E7P6_9RHOB|nr:WD-40 repeat protein [Candidatus Rhodobacter lobularis]KMW58770.1 Vegetatible incompatibility protein HET-E-1 [Candidatus Rhodobacter lobularis]
MQGGVEAEPARKTGLKPTALEQRGTRYAFGAPVTAAVSVGETVVVSFGDGMLRFFREGRMPQELKLHEGVILCLAADGDGHVLTGGDDGQFLRTSLDGHVDELAHFGTRWVDCVAASHGHIACSSGKEAHVWTAGQSKVTVFEHASTVGGLAFDAKGKRLAVTYYGGATVWAREKRWKASKLVWKGFHGDTCFSPDGKYLVTCMQENALHAWRLRDKGDFAMPGYPAKIKSLAWVGDAPHLVTSGADEAIAWPFDGKKGPLGRKPVCVAYNQDELVTCLRTLPGENAVFAGYRDGAVQLAELDEAKQAIVISGSTGAEVTAIVVSGLHILVGDAKGNVLWAPLWEGTSFAQRV